MLPAGMRVAGLVEQHRNEKERQCTLIGSSNSSKTTIATISCVVVRIKTPPSQEYARIVGCLLEGEPKVLSQDVGLPDPVTYRSKVATTFDKYLVRRVSESPQGNVA